MGRFFLRTTLLLVALLFSFDAGAAYRQSTSTSNSSTTIASCTVPAGAATNDIAIIIVSWDRSDVLPLSYPSGFTELDSATNTLDGEAYGVGWKRLTGADSGSYTFGAIGATSAYNCHVLLFSGRHTTNNPASTENINNSGNTSPVSVSATGLTAVAGDDLLYIGGLDLSAAGVLSGFTEPSGYTERQDTCSSNGWVCIETATIDNVGAGATGTVTGTATLSSDTSAFVSYLVRIPAAAGGGPTCSRNLLTLGVGC